MTRGDGGVRGASARRRAAAFVRCRRDAVRFVSPPRACFGDQAQWSHVVHTARELVQSPLPLLALDPAAARGVLVGRVPSAAVGVGAPALAVTPAASVLGGSHVVAGAVDIAGAPSASAVTWYTVPVSGMLLAWWGVGPAVRPCGSSQSLRLARLRRREGGVLD